MNINSGYTKMFNHLNKEIGYKKYVTVEEVEERKKLGIGSTGLFIQMLAYMSFGIPFLHWPDTTSGIIAIILSSVFLFIFLLILGYIISWRYEKKHFFARSGIVFFAEFSIPILTAVIIVLLLTQIVSESLMNNFLTRL